MEQARLTPGRGFSPAQSLMYYTQRLVTNSALRRCIVAGLKTAVNTCQGFPQMELNQGIGTPSMSQVLLEDGYMPLPILLDQTQVDDIHAFLNRKRMQERNGERRSFTIDNIPRSPKIADYRLRDIVDCPHILDLANSPMLLGLAANYLGCKPTISALGLRWSFPSTESGTGLQAFHRDSDDWRFVKVFVYLTDVDAESGPHVYVRGSHLTQAPVRLRPYDDRQVEDLYGKDKLLTVTGPRGFGFAADTYGIHKGKVPLKRPRLLLQIQYSMLPVYAYRYRPEVYKGSRHFDPYTNRLILSQRACGPAERDSI